MPGVMFDRESAKRIADGTRKIERIPGGEQDLQRRRAGGLGRSTLWEVTAVQTGPGTVTIKRVSNIAFDLNDPSEKIDILYDPDNEPAVGDRGLLIRLGNGNLFFFKRDIGVEILQTIEYAYVNEDVPGSNFGYPTQAKARQYFPDINNDRWAIMKFSSPAVGSYKEIIFAEVLSVGSRIFISSDNQDFNTGEHADLHIFTIDQDFDASTITWTTAQSLSLTSLGFIDFTLEIRMWNYTDPRINSWIQDIEQNLVGDKNTFGSDPALDGAYGLLIKGHVGPNIADELRIDFEFRRGGVRNPTHAVKSFV